MKGMNGMKKKREFGTNLMRRGLAVLLAALLAVPVLTVRAAETEAVEETGTDAAGAEAAETEAAEVGTAEAETAGTDSLDVSGNEAGEDRGVAPVAAAENQSGSFSDTDGDGSVLSWSYDAGAKTLTVSGTGELGSQLLGEPFASMEMKKIVFQGCKVIGSMVNAFGSYRSSIHGLEEIDLAGLDTSSVTNMGDMFYGCSGLTSLDVSGLDTGSVTDMWGMFYGCSGLTSLDVSGLDTGSVTDMGVMFSGCGSLAGLDVSGFDTSSVTDMSWMFYRCSSLASLDVSGFDTSSVTDMSWMFFNCRSLVSLDVSGFDTSSVTDMREMFAFCRSLVSLDVSGFDTSGVTDMGHMFGACGSLASLDVSGFDTSGVTDMGEMFWGCSSLASLDVSGFDTSSVTDMEYMFADCYSLTSLDLSSFNMSKVDKSSYMLRDCTKLDILKSPKAIPNGRGFNLPASYYDADVYDNTGVKSTVTWLDASCAGKTFKKYEEADDSDSDEAATALPGAVQYVTYSHTFPNASVNGQDGAVFSISDGSLPNGIALRPNGELYGVPMETGTFNFTVALAASADSAALEAVNARAAASETRKVYTLTVLDNTDLNAEGATDAGYEIVERIPDFTTDSITDQTLVSVGEYSEFRNVYIDGVKLEEGKDYTSEAGSTRVTILSETLEQFSQPGTHTIVVEFWTSDTNEVKRAVQNYHVAGSGDSGEEGDGNSGSGTGSGLDGGNGSGGTGNGEHGGAAGTPIYYTVVRGDTLGGIARGRGMRLAQILAWNPQIKNPNLIFPGQRIVVGYQNGAAMPDYVEGAVYDEVRRGDSLYRIARRNGVSLKTIIVLNPEIAKQKYIYAGQRIRVR